MLKRIGLGLIIALFSTLFVMIVDIWFADFSYPSFRCPSNIENHSNTSTIMIVNYKWLLFPHITFGCAFFLVFVTSLEFTVAQSPRQMRGLWVGLWYATSYGTGTVVSTGFSLVLLELKSFSRGCLFYYHFGICVFLFLTFIFFLMFAKHYKLRIRDNIVPIYQIAEEHYERYFNQSEEYRREYWTLSFQLRDS